jgi:hypothetical protein
VNGLPPPKMLDRISVVAAIAEYLLEANYRGYQPDPRKVLVVRKSDRTTSLREAAAPVRGEAFYFIEGELFPLAGSTQLAADETPKSQAEKLVSGIWDQLWVWNAYDFARSTSGWSAP